MRLSPTVFAAALSLSLLTACGGGDDDSGSDAADSGGDTLTKEEFISQGDAICASLRDDTNQLTPPADQTTGFATFIREASALGQGARDEFSELAAPEDGKAVQEALLDSLDTALETLEGAAVAADDGDTVSAGDLLRQAGEEGDASDAEAQEYGFKECGKESEDEAAGGGGEEPAGGEALTKEEFIAAGDEVCQGLADATEAVAEPADETDLARYLNEVLPLAADAREAFAALTPPEDGVAVQEELLAALDSSLEAGASASIAAEQGDTVTAGDLLAEASAAGDAANPSAQAYGFQQCGNDAG